jgi:hypothetical protein
VDARQDPNAELAETIKRLQKVAGLRRSCTPGTGTFEAARVEEARLNKRVMDLARRRSRALG